MPLKGDVVEVGNLMVISRQAGIAYIFFFGWHTSLAFLSLY